VGLRLLTWHFSHRRCRPAARVDGTGVLLKKKLTLLTNVPPDQISLLSKTTMSQLKYSQVKQIMLDSVSIIANAIIDGTRSPEDVQSLRLNLRTLIEDLSDSNLSKQSLKEVEDIMQMLKESADRVSNNQLPMPTDFGWSLTRGASPKEFQEWSCGGLGIALANQAESILGRDWKMNSEFSLGN